jgi:hypothetical protein
MIKNVQVEIPPNAKNIIRVLRILLIAKNDFK